MLIDTSLHQISLMSCIKEYKYLPGKPSTTKQQIRRATTLCVKTCYSEVVLILLATNYIQV